MNTLMVYYQKIIKKLESEKETYKKENENLKTRIKFLENTLTSLQKPL